VCSTFADCEVNEATTNETTRGAATIKNINPTFVTDGTDVAMATVLRILKTFSAERGF